MDVRRLDEDQGHRQLHLSNEAHIRLNPTTGSVVSGTYTIDLCATMDLYPSISPVCEPITVIVNDPPGPGCTYTIDPPTANQAD